MPLRRPSLLRKIADNVRALASGQAGEDIEGDRRDPTLPGESDHSGPILRGDAVSPLPLPNGSSGLVKANGDDGRASEGVDDSGERFHVSRTIQNVVHTVNTNGNASDVTLEGVATLADRLDLLQERGGFSTLADFARAAGIEPGTARQQRARNSIPVEVAPSYVRAAKATGATVEWLLYGTGSGPSRTVEAPVPARMDLSTPSVPMIQERQPPGPPDVPVWASAEGGMDGAIILTPDPVDYLRRSERMLTVKNPFAFQIIGSSMSPAVEHGDQVVINPALHARIGNDCVFVQERSDGTFLAMVKRLLRVTSDNWQVRQFEPVKDFKLVRKLWTRAFVIDEIRRAR